MNTNSYTISSLLLGFTFAFVACWVLLPLLIRLSPTLGLVDRPNSRKVHHQLIPAIGGLTIGLAVCITTLMYTPLQTLLNQHTALTLASVILVITGVIDDRLNIWATLRLLIQVGCSVAVAHYGIRLSSMHGVFGITELPLLVQYAVTVLILTGMANAFNLIDGIDGLAGSLALANCVLLSLLAWLANQPQWLYLLFPLAGALVAFLKFNWRPARLFMGDGGSVVLGFLMASLGISLIEGAYTQSIPMAHQLVALVTASCMIPVMDALRVFSTRIRHGLSPFSADRNHMHHWLLKHHFAHSQVTLRVVRLHVLLLFLSFVASFIVSMATVFVFQGILVLLYTLMIQLSHAFLRSYRLVKQLEIT